MNAFNHAFNQTTAGQIAADTLNSFAGKPTTDSMTAAEKIRLMQFAAAQEKEEFIDTIISLLPPEIRLAAAEIYDRLESGNPLN